MLRSAKDLDAPLSQRACTAGSSFERLAFVYPRVEKGEAGTEDDIYASWHRLSAVSHNAGGSTLGVQLVTNSHTSRAGELRSAPSGPMKP